MLDTKCPSETFEADYLQANPDVLRAVQAGDFESGWEHYLTYGYYEQRPGIPPDVDQIARQLFSADPSPPDALRQRVHGQADSISFERSGKMVALHLHRAISPRLTLTETSRILDFGCGCDRVMRHLRQLWGPCQFYGSDIDAEAITWCQNHLADAATFTVNDSHPPLSYPDDDFDCIYSISVFTHLPEAMQFAWLKELHRIAKPGSYLLLTTHGPQLFQAKSWRHRWQFARRGFFYHVGPGTVGLPDFYQTSFHTETYIRKHWSQFFQIQHIIHRGIVNHQDLVICRKPG